MYQTHTTRVDQDKASEYLFDNRHDLAFDRTHYKETLSDETIIEMASHWCDGCHDYLKEETEEVDTSRYCAFHRANLFPNYFDEQGVIRPI